MLKKIKVLLLISLLLTSSAVIAYPKVEVDTMIDFTAEDSVALKQELLVMNNILSNPQFWANIKKAQFYCTAQRTYHSKRKRKSRYPKQKKDKHNYTSQEIHDLLWFGQDEIGGLNDKIINLKLKAKDYPKNKNGSQTHGSTNSGTLIISSDRKTRIHAKTKGKYAAHLLHEYMHVLGFKHKSNSPSINKQKCGGIDIPLRIQKIAEQILHQI